MAVDCWCTGTYIDYHATPREKEMDRVKERWNREWTFREFPMRLTSLIFGDSILYYVGHVSRIIYKLNWRFHSFAGQILCGGLVCLSVLNWIIVSAIASLTLSEGVKFSSYFSFLLPWESTKYAKHHLTLPYRRNINTHKQRMGNAYRGVF